MSCRYHSPVTTGMLNFFFLRKAEPAIVRPQLTFHVGAKAFHEVCNPQTRVER